MAQAAVEAFYIDNPEQKLTLEQLKSLGVLHWALDADNYEKEGKLAKICEERNYNYKDFVNSEKIPDLKSKLAIFFEEHIHDDEEIRFFLDGSGFFDVRDGKDPADRWVRIVCKKGDMLVIPAGIYHRFNPDEKMFFHVMRLFCGDPVWTPHNRSLAETEERPSRKAYVSTFLKN